MTTGALTESGLARLKAEVRAYVIEQQDAVPESEHAALWAELRQACGHSRALLLPAGVIVALLDAAERTTVAELERDAAIALHDRLVDENARLTAQLRVWMPRDEVWT